MINFTLSSNFVKQTCIPSAQDLPSRNRAATAVFGNKAALTLNEPRLIRNEIFHIDAHS